LITEKPRPLPLSMAAHGPFILTIDRGRGLGHWQKGTITQDIELFTDYSSIYGMGVVIYNCPAINETRKAKKPSKPPLSAAQGGTPDGI